MSQSEKVVDFSFFFFDVSKILIWYSKNEMKMFVFENEKILLDFKNKECKLKQFKF